MQLTPGTKLAEYEILTSIGAGGMGEVYKARDTKLGREVAIKVLPEAFSQDKERLARFEREARLLASLNHPNIATIYDLEESDGINFLVLEFVPGETLAERIKRGPIPVDEALPLLKQIAEGLEAAHEKGVIHRDLKPANIKVTPEGKPKVLDFGLAKAMAGEARDQGLSESPTMTRGATEAGILLGTAPYMSPEQARGKAVDKRTDIWAFGCCLYEAVTGKTAFLGETVSDTIARIIEREPDWKSLPPTTPASIQRLLRRCLQKDQSCRMRDVGDARIEIEEILSEPLTAPEVVRLERSIGPSVLVVLAALILGGFVVWSLTRSTTPVPGYVTRATIPLQPGREIRLGAIPHVAISPDGKHIAYCAQQGDSRHLFMRAVDRLEAALIDGSEGATMPFFSPDSQWVGFLLRPSGKLMKVSVSGGAPVAIAAIGNNIRGASWAPDGTIVFNSHANTGLSRVSAEGGEPEVLTTPNREQGEKTHRLPDVLPGSKTVLFTIGTSDAMSFDDSSIAVLSLETGEYRVILEGGSNARYSETGHLIYARAGSLLAVPFDKDDHQIKGVPVPVLQGLATSDMYGVAEFSVSKDGSLVYAPGSSWAEKNRLLWIDREGQAQPIIETLQAFYNPKYSPDGQLLALGIEGANNTLWVYDLVRGTMTRLSFSFDADDPIWTPDGRRLTYAFNREGVWNIFWQAADGGGQAERLTTSEYVQFPRSWSPDGMVLAFDERRPNTRTDISVLSLDGNRTAELFLQTTFNEEYGMFCPSGRCIAYSSDESGQYEVYVRAFPSSQGKRQVSTGGGTDPVWNPNGEELFYRSGDRMMVVDVRTEGELVLGKPRQLFSVPSLRPEYDVSPDGQRFVMMERVESRPVSNQLILVQNWGEELKRLVPVN